MGGCEMMRWGIIATWYFSKEGVRLAANLLSEGKTADEAVKVAINDVENMGDCQTKKVFVSLTQGG